MPDGDLVEWEGRSEVRWLPGPAPGPHARHFRGRDDLQARVGLAAYPRGLSLAVDVTDDHHRPAAHAAAFDQSDHVQVELWPEGGGSRAKALAEDSPAAEAVGVRLRLGTRRQLVEFLRPREAWRAEMTSSAGVDRPGGYRVEARLPLAVLTPLASAMISAVRYEIIVFDADADHAAEPTLVFSGRVELGSAMELPEAAQRRASLRVCLAAEPQALWGYRDGWRCAVPHHVRWVGEDDRQLLRRLQLGHHRTPEPPVLQWLRERMIFVNLVGVERGVAALLDRRDTILSVLRLGVVGSRDPGNALARDADAVPFKLPDGTWAVTVTHAYPSRTGAAGGRCAAGHQVYASIIAVRGAPESTPHKPAPEPDPPPHLEEVFRTLLEDCRQSQAREWTLSEDRKVIQVQDLVNPARPVQTHEYRDGWYQEVTED